VQLAVGVTPGNTGGAVVSTRGLVVGMIKAKVSEPFYLDPMYCRTGEGQSPLIVPGRRLELPTSPVALAVPAQTALREARRIVEAGTEARAYVGIYVDDLEGWYALHFKTTDGVLVTGVVSRTPADISGLQQGDVITSVDRTPVQSVTQFRQLIAQATPGQRLHMAIVRGGQAMRLVIEAGSSGAPHLNPTDNMRRPFPATFSSANSAVPNSAAVAVEKAEDLASKTEAAPTEPERRGSTLMTKEERWQAMLNAMQHTIDSLKEEVLILQQEIKP
jgi:hypothetical protein